MRLNEEKFSFSSATIAGNCLENLRSYNSPAPLSRLPLQPPGSVAVRLARVSHADMLHWTSRTSGQHTRSTALIPHSDSHSLHILHSPFSFASWHCRSIAQTLFVCTDFASFHLRFSGNLSPVNPCPTDNQPTSSIQSALSYYCSDPAMVG